MTVRTASQLFDAETLEAIHRKAIYLCRGRKSRTHDVDDLSQELATRLHQASLKYDSTRLPWKQYVRMILSRAGTDQIRRSRARKRDASRTVCLNPGSEDESRSINASDVQRTRHRGYFPRDDQSRLQLRLDVARIIGCLPLRYREIAELLPEKTLKEIARQLNIDRGTLTARLRKMRRRFIKSDLAQYLGE